MTHSTSLMIGYYCRISTAVRALILSQRVGDFVMRAIVSPFQILTSRSGLRENTLVRKWTVVNVLCWLPHFVCSFVHSLHESFCYLLNEERPTFSAPFPAVDMCKSHLWLRVWFPVTHLFSWLESPKIRNFYWSLLENSLEMCENHFWFSLVQLWIAFNPCNRAFSRNEFHYKISHHVSEYCGTWTTLLDFWTLSLSLMSVRVKSGFTSVAFGPPVPMVYRVFFF